MTTAQHAGTESPRRLVLIGRTGLDGRLRLDDQFELVRARSSLDAIGELASRNCEGVKPVVIVDAGAEPDNEAETREMIEAMRIARPEVRILRAGGAADAGAYDGRIGPDDPVEAIRRLIRADAADTAGATDPAGAAPPEPVRSEPRPPRQEDEPDPAEALLRDLSVPELDLADGQLALAMARGSDILTSALNVLRRRTGDPGLRFSPEGAAGAAVTSAGAIVGRLRSDRLPEAKLTRAAAWLGAWITLRDQHIQLREAAFTDALTGAWNRRYFERFLDAALRDARRLRHEVTLLVFDIDDFKQYNDQYGHAAGDEILIEAVRLMRSVVRPSDRVCRIGGDEFAVIFNEPEGPRQLGSRRPTSVMQIAERFQKQIALARFPKLGEDAPGPLTVSGGLATYPWDAHDPESMLRLADERALVSKRQGKNAITFGA